jgi:magnesium transporter
MTPSYVAVREDWTVRQVLDHIREHGQDSETLDVIYVVDQQGLLVDDIRLRELLLTSPDNHIHDLMDHRFIALKATDDQQTAVAAFRSYDRTALPVTDTAGMLIGIVTIDDVLDVAEATATKEIQRIGGSEALDEPYMEIAFWRMIHNSGGWLTELFIAELLSRLGAFESEISKAVVLAMFIPAHHLERRQLGSQASTWDLSARRRSGSGIGGVMRREILAGLAPVRSLAASVYAHFHLVDVFKIYGELALVAGTVAWLVGIVPQIGSTLPLHPTLGFDPATSSAPFVAPRRRHRAWDLFQRRARACAAHYYDGFLRVRRGRASARLCRAALKGRPTGADSLKARARERCAKSTPNRQRSQGLPFHRRSGAQAEARASRSQATLREHRSSARWGPNTGGVRVQPD